MGVLGFLVMLGMAMAMAVVVMAVVVVAMPVPMIVVTVGGMVVVAMGVMGDGVGGGVGRRVAVVVMPVSVIVVTVLWFRGGFGEVRPRAAQARELLGRYAVAPEHQHVGARALHQWVALAH